MPLGARKCLGACKCVCRCLPARACVRGSSLAVGTLGASLAHVFPGARALQGKTLLDARTRNMRTVWQTSVAPYRPRCCGVGGDTTRKCMQASACLPRFSPTDKIKYRSQSARSGLP